MHFDDDYQGEGTPLSDTSRTIIIVIHYSVFPAVGFAIYALMKNIHVLPERIWSPFLLMTTLTWLQMAAAFEIANHFYVDNWQIYDPQADLINGSFSFFNFGAQNLLALSLRKKDLTFYRKGSGIADWFCITYMGSRHGCLDCIESYFVWSVGTINFCHCLVAAGFDLWPNHSIPDLEKSWSKCVYENRWNWLLRPCDDGSDHASCLQCN